MGQLEKYGLYVLCLVIFMILGVALWGDPSTVAAERGGRRDAAPISAPGTTGPKEGPKTPQNIAGVNLDELLGSGKDGGKGPAPRNDVQGGNGGNKPADQPAPVVALDTKRPVYTIKAGDSFETIARTQLKDVGLRDLVMQLNPDVLPNRMRLGKEIVLPSAAEIGARKMVKEATVDKAPPKVDGKSPETKSPETKPVAPIAAEGRVYTVKKGDTLLGIAQAELGSQKRLAELMAANPGVEPAKLRQGQKLKLPKK